MIDNEMDLFHYVYDNLSVSGNYPEMRQRIIKLIRQNLKVVTSASLYTLLHDIACDIEKFGEFKEKRYEILKRMRSFMDASENAKNTLQDTPKMTEQELIDQIYNQLCFDGASSEVRDAILRDIEEFQRNRSEDQQTPIDQSGKKELRKMSLELFYIGYELSYLKYFDNECRHPNLTIEDDIEEALRAASRALKKLDELMQD